MMRRWMHMFTAFSVMGVLVLLFFWLTGGVWAGANTPQGTAATPVPVGTGFTYQGELLQGGSPANGKFDFRFRLFDAASGGSQVGPTVTRDDVQVTNGRFTVVLDFGKDVFKGDARWLEIAVRPGTSTGAYTSLSPRQRLRPVPYALALLGFWTQADAKIPNVIGGYRGNTVASGVFAATISGGGADVKSSDYLCAPEPIHFQKGGDIPCINRVTYSYGTVSGGYGNTAGEHAATVSGGFGNWAMAPGSNIGGGAMNFVVKKLLGYSPDGIPGYAGGGTIGGGGWNVLTGRAATIGGGFRNLITGTAPFSDGLESTIAGGAFNRIFGYMDAIGGGYGNIITGTQSTIGGGYGNIIGMSGGYGYIPITITQSTIAGGYRNIINDSYSAIGGGRDNFVAAPYATIAGGNGNKAMGSHSTIGGGTENSTTAQFATVAGGDRNTASGDMSTVGGGVDNYAIGQFATVAGGYLNGAEGKGATIPGGQYAWALDYGQFAYASGGFDETAGSAQYSIYVLRAQTPISNDWFELFLDGNGERISVPMSRTMTFDILVTARDSYGLSASWTIQGAVENTGGTTQLLGTPMVTTISNDHNWAVEVDADDANDALVIRVKGMGEGPIRWVAVVRAAQVGW